MIKIKPSIQNDSNCPYCQTPLTSNKMLWQGMHICAESACHNCHAKIIEDVKVGHANFWTYQVDLDKSLVFGDESSKGWLGQPLIKSLQNPEIEKISITKEVFKQCDQVIILNCIDYLYGHCLLKLLNAQRHLERNPEYGLVVIIQKFLRWMLPEGVAEIWTVDIPLRKGQSYYPSLDTFIQRELERFSNVYLSKAYSHPGEFDITDFTRVKKHDFHQKEFRVTFIWREDRLWCNELISRIVKKLKLTSVGLLFQNWKVKKLFKTIRSQIPTAKFTVVGLGQQTSFPNWIEDLRVNKFDPEKEKAVCQVYSESRLVIGVHGSNMLLPSGHAGMTIDLMPKYRWGNFAQDILYQESDPRLASFRYQYLPIETNLNILIFVASAMLLNFSHFKLSMTADQLL